MVIVLSYLVSSVLLALSLLHLYWVAGGCGGLQAVLPQLPSGPLVFKPPRAATALVALGLLGASSVVLLHAHRDLWPTLEGVGRAGVWALCAVFALRGLGEGRYVGLSKRVRDTPFARMDSLIYTPLSLGLALALFVLARG